MAKTAPASESLQEALGTLTPEDWMLVRLRDQLYGGRWAEMRTDLHSRRRGEPYIFKLVHRIEEDLQRIERLEAVEQRWSIDLGEHLPADA